jgi:minor extracellular serine protease Vpr
LGNHGLTGVKIFERLNRMGLRFSSAQLKCLAPAIIIMLCVFQPAGASSAVQSSQDNSIPTKSLARMMIPGTQDVQLIIELSDPGVLEKIKGSVATTASERGKRLSERNRPIDFTSKQALAYRHQVSQKKESFRTRILQFEGAQVSGGTDVVMNTVIARVHASHYGAIRRLPGVKKVYFSHRYKMLLDQAAVLQNAQGLWTGEGGQSQAGKGVKIGLIDSGIDITNPMFTGTGLSTPSGFPKYDSQADRALTNSKVIVARNYVNPSLGFYPQRVQSATDEVGHGTFIAGCAAGEQVNAPLATISGMAPGAFLGSYKIFGTPGINDSATTEAIVAAIDDAVADGMDVINLSLGSLDYIPPSEDAEAVAIEKAVQAGVVVTVAAGNDGSMAHSIDSPGTADGAITVGSVTNSRQFLAALHTNSTSPDLSTIGYLPSGDGMSITSSLPFTNIVDVASLDGNGLACSAFPSGSLQNSIALIERGTCNFSVKVDNAAAAGAIAAVIYNNNPGGLVSMGGLRSATIPAVMISQSDGTALKNYIDSNPAGAQVAIDNSQILQPVPTTTRVVSSFSSVGPGTDFTIKPDLVAVGENLYSAALKSASGLLYDPSGFMVSQGTSFSAPMVAGAAAGLREHFPSLGAQAIKSLLTTTASRNLTVDGVNSPNVLQAGSGLLNMGNALAATAVFSPTSLNFGVHSYTGTLSTSATLTIENISSSADQFTIELEPIVGGPTITFSQTTSGSIAPGATTSVDISLQTTSPASGGFQGFVTVRSSSTSFVYRIPYWAGVYVPDRTRVLPVSQSASGPGSFSSVADALAAAQPGNIIEIEDSGTYPAGSGGLVISTNSQGLPLHGIAIRAAAGQTPVIDGSGLTGSGNPANIRVVGLQNVLIQGLTINNGYTGLDLYQPSKTLPLSVTIDHCTISNSAGDSKAAGVLIDGGGSVEITQSTVTGSSGTGIVAGAFADGTQLTLLNTTVQGNGNDGLDAFGSDVYISNSTFSKNSGAGLYLDYCTGTLNGNTFAQNQTFVVGRQFSYGDGIQIADGTLSITSNLFDSNDGAGMVLLPGDQTRLGPTVQLLRNRVRGNGDYGIISNPAVSVVADSNLIEDNAGGIYLNSTASAKLLNNIIVRSRDSGIGNGIKINGGSNVRIVNDTIYQNVLRGVVLASGTVSIANSIIDANAGGDLQGVATGSVQSSLVSADPKFVNPASDDFSPSSGSPAVDAGSNTATDLPFLDFNGRLRIASATALPGVGTVDIGSVEANSDYPLIIPAVINGSEPSLGGAYTTGISLLNAGSSSTQINLAAYNGAAGDLLEATQNPRSLPLEAASQVPMLYSQMFAFDSTTPALGGVLASSQSSVIGFFLITDREFSHFATGANTSSKAGSDVIFMRPQSNSAATAKYAVFNPGINAANITANLYDSSGARIAQQTAVIPPKGQVILQFGSSLLFSGYVRVQSDRPVSGLEIIGNANFLSALSGVSPDLQTRLFFPFFVVGGNYSTRIGIVNTSGSSANLTISSHDDNGNLLGSRSAAIPAGGQLLQAIADLSGISADGPTQTGYVVARSDKPGIVGFSHIIYNNGVISSDAATPAESMPIRHLLFPDVIHGVSSGSGVPYRTGIVLLNPFGTSIGYSIRVFDEAGKPIAQSDDTIGPHQKIGKVLSSPAEGSGFFTQPITLGSGHIEVVTDYGLLGMEVFFTDDLSQMASLPAQSGD